MSATVFSDLVIVDREVHHCDYWQKIFKIYINFNIINLYIKLNQTNNWKKFIYNFNQCYVFYKIPNMMLHYEGGKIILKKHCSLHQ